MTSGTRARTKLRATVSGAPGRELASGSRARRGRARGARAAREGARRGRARGSSSLRLHAEAGLGRGGLLEFRTEPADQARALFGGTGGVEFDQAEKNVFGGKIRGPAVGFGDGAIEIVVEVAEDRDEAVVVNRLAGGD